MTVFPPVLRTRKYFFQLREAVILTYGSGSRSYLYIFVSNEKKLSNKYGSNINIL